MNILYICHAKCPSQAEKGSCCPLRGNVKNGWIPYYYFYVQKNYTLSDTGVEGHLNMNMNAHIASYQ